MRFFARANRAGHDRAAFDGIYAEHFRFVWQNLRRLGVRPENLDDATQDVFMVVYRHIDERSRYSSDKAWLCGIAVRVASDQRRRLRRKEGRHQPLVGNEFDAARPTPFDDAAQAQAATVFDQLVDELPEDQRAIFVWTELEGMTAKAIGEALGLNSNTVSSRLRAARARFNQLVAERQAWSAAHRREGQG